MVRVINRNILIIAFLTLIVSCSGNRFKDSGALHTFTFGIKGYDAFEFCKKKDPYFILYKNGVNPTRTCIHYGYYKCHVEHYCNGDKDCEDDAKRYWISNDWYDEKGSKIDGLGATVRYCERVKKQCDYAKYGDHTCRK